MARVQMYTTAWCGYCVRAKALLDGKGIEYDEINLDDDPRFRQKLLELTGGWTVPQILVDGEPIGGVTELLGVPQDGGGRRRPPRPVNQVSTKAQRPPLLVRRCGTPRAD